MLSLGAGLHLRPGSDQTADLSDLCFRIFFPPLGSYPAGLGLIPIPKPFRHSPVLTVSITVPMTFPTCVLPPCRPWVAWGPQHYALPHAQYKQGSAPKWQCQDYTSCYQVIQDSASYTAHAILTSSARKFVPRHVTLNNKTQPWGWGRTHN